MSFHWLLLLRDAWVDAIFGAILFRSGVHVFAEERVEALIAVKAAVEGDFGDVDIGALQQKAGALNFLLADFFVDAVSADFLEVYF